MTDKPTRKPKAKKVGFLEHLSRQVAAMTPEEREASYANATPRDQEGKKAPDLAYLMVFEVGSAGRSTTVETNGGQVYITFTASGGETTLVLTKANMRGNILDLTTDPNIFQVYGANGLTITLGISRIWTGVRKHLQALSVSLRTDKQQEIGTLDLPLIRVLDALA